MKTTRKLLFLLILVAGNLCGSQKVDSAQAARIFHNNIRFVAENCDYLPVDIQKKLIIGIDLERQELKCSDLVATYTSKIRGKDLFAYARAKQCEKCRLFLAEEQTIQVLIEITNNLGIGELTLKDLNKKMAEDAEFCDQINKIGKELESKNKCLKSIR